MLIVYSCVYWVVILMDDQIWIPTVQNQYVYQSGEFDAIRGMTFVWP